MSYDEQMLQNDGAEKECASMPSEPPRIAAIVDEQEWRQFQQVRGARVRHAPDTFVLM